MDIKLFASGVGNGGSGASNLIAIWSSATVLNADSNFAYDGTTFKLALDMRMNEAGTAAAQAKIRQRANTGSLALWGASTATGSYIELFGNSHATKANLIEIGASATSITIDAASGYIKTGAGAAATPAWTFGGFATTGMYAAAGPILGFATGGAAAGTIDSSQKWTIGATSGTQYHRVNGRGFDIVYANSGVTAYVSITHSSNTANSGAAFYASVAGGSAQDPYLALNVASATDWCIGIRNASSDAFQIANSASLGTNVYFQISTGGLITLGASGATQKHALNVANQSTVGAAGAASALPAQPQGYVLITLNGTDRVIPYYAAS